MTAELVLILAAAVVLAAVVLGLSGTKAIDTDEDVALVEEIPNSDASDQGQAPSVSPCAK